MRLWHQVEQIHNQYEFRIFLTHLIDSKILVAKLLFGNANGWYWMNRKHKHRLRYNIIFSVLSNLFTYYLNFYLLK